MSRACHRIRMRVPGSQKKTEAARWLRPVRLCKESRTFTVSTDMAKTVTRSDSFSSGWSRVESQDESCISVVCQSTRREETSRALVSGRRRTSVSGSGNSDGCPETVAETSKSGNRSRIIWSASRICRTWPSDLGGEHVACIADSWFITRDGDAGDMLKSRSDTFGQQRGTFLTHGWRWVTSAYSHPSPLRLVHSAAPWSLADSWPSLTSESICPA